jgi:hypothetical protein
MPTDQEIIERVERALAEPPIQQRVSKMLEQRMRGFIGMPITPATKSELQAQATEGIRQILDELLPEKLSRVKKFKVELVDDESTPTGLVMRVNLEF